MVVSPTHHRKPWEGRRVLVTGHTGFKGSWLVTWLDMLGARVHGFALPPSSQPNLHDLLDVPSFVSGRFGDVRDRDAVARAFDAAKPDVVFHLAAQPLVRASYDDPLGTFATNVMGTAHVLDVARAHEPAAVVIVTSDKCYDQRGVHAPFRESDPLGGHDPYSASKAAAEIVAASYRRSYFERGATVATARAGNVVGGGDWSADRLVPDIVKAAQAGRPLHLRHPSALRPWQHVLDALAGYLTVAERALTGDRTVGRAWNFGPLEAALTVEEVTHRLLRALNSAIPIVVDAQAGPHEAAQLALDASDAVDLLQWRPRFDIDATIQATAAWYDAYAHRADIRALTRAQIGGAVRP
jgi:CDP-glucose 4,6-dehydratase